LFAFMQKYKQTMSMALIKRVKGKIIQ